MVRTTSHSTKDRTAPSPKNHTQSTYGREGLAGWTLRGMRRNDVRRRPRCRYIIQTVVCGALNSSLRTRQDERPAVQHALVVHIYNLQPVAPPSPLDSFIEATQRTSHVPSHPVTHTASFKARSQRRFMKPPRNDAKFQLVRIESDCSRENVTTSKRNVTTVFAR